MGKEDKNHVKNPCTSSIIIEKEPRWRISLSSFRK